MCAARKHPTGGPDDDRGSQGGCYRLDHDADVSETDEHDPRRGTQQRRLGDRIARHTELDGERTDRDERRDPRSDGTPVGPADGHDRKLDLEGGGNGKADRCAERHARPEE